MTIEYLPIVFFLIAFFYSSVGFGGGSSYLAILSLFLTDFYEIRSTALLLNTCVASIGTLVFIRNKVFDLKLFWPFLVSSIPLAFVGAQIRLSQKMFFLILGSMLIFSGVFLLLRFIATEIVSKEFSFLKKLTLGGSIGLLSGISGIGGGIFLSPALNLLNWANPRTIAALASFFIFVNSVSGLIGLTVGDTFQLNAGFSLELMIAAILGGSVGSYLSNKKIKLRFLGILTAILVFYVGLRLVLFHGYGVKI